MPARTLLKYAGLAIAGLLTLLALAWLATPAWLPAIAAGQLPEGWRLDAVEVRRPALGSISIPHARLGMPALGGSVVVEIQDGHINWRNPAIVVEKLNLVLERSPPGEADNTAFALPSIPPLLLPAAFPPLTIHELVLPGLPGGAKLDVQRGIDRLQLSLAGAEGAITLDVLQTLDAEGYATTFGLDADAGRLLLLLAPYLDKQALPDLQQLAGRVQLDARFAGPLQQTLQRFDFDLQDLDTQLRGLAISGHLAGGGRLQETGLALQVSQPGQVNLQGPPDAWPAFVAQALGDTLQAAGISYPGPGDAAVTVQLELATDTAVTLDLQDIYPLSLAGNVQLTARQGSEQFTAGLNAAQLAVSGPGLAGITLQPSATWSVTSQKVLRIDLGEQSVSVAGLALSGALEGMDAPLKVSGAGTLGPLSLPGLGLSGSGADLQWTRLDLDTLAGDFALQAGDLELVVEDQTLQGFGLTVTGSLDAAGSASGAGQLQVKQAPAVDWQFDAQLESGIINVQLLPGSIAASDLKALLAPLALPWPTELKLSAGTIAYSGRFRSADRLTGGLQAEGRGLAATIVKSTLSGLAFTMDLSLDERLTIEGRFSAPLASLAAGLDMIDLTGRMHVAEAIELHDFSAGLFGGTLQLELARVTEAGLQPSVLTWQGLQLQPLLAFVDVGGLSGAGQVNATLPLRSKAAGLAVEGGSYLAIGPGRLAYSGGAAATNIGLQALENFQFDELSGSVDYDPEGPYAVGVLLLGRNPDLYSGYPIKFNLNLTGELPAVFRSLFLTGSFEEALLERIRGGAEPLP